MASSNNKLVRALVLSGSASERLVAPSVDWALLTADRRLSFTTTMRVVSWALDDTADVWLSTKSSVLTRFTDLLVLVLSVADFTDSRFAFAVDHSHFSTR